MELAKCLIIDDEITSKEAKQGFLHLIKVPEKYAIFSHHYKEAKQIISSRQDIAFCFLDCRIPEDERLRNYSINVENLNFIDYGIRLIPEIKYTPTVIYSAYIEESSLKKKADGYTNIVGALAKPFNEQILLEIRKTYLEKLFVDSSFDNNKIEVLSFDYSFLVEEDLFFVRDRTRKIKQLRRRATQDIIDIGTYLIEVKDKLKHGQFEKWIKAEFEWSGTTAKRFMAVASTFKSTSLVDLENIVNTALYVLASPTTPQEAVEEAISRAKEGETISEQKAKEVRKKHSSKSSKQKTISPKAAEEKGGFKVDLSDSKSSIEQINKAININKNKVIEDSNSLLSSQNRERTVYNSAEKAKSSLFNRPLKQQIISVQQNIENKFWQFEDHRLFCGNPTSNLFLNRIPKKIALHLNFPPNSSKNTFSKIEADARIELTSVHTDIKLDAIKTIVKTAIFEFTLAEEIVVFSYIFDLAILKLALDMDCCCWIAEPNLVVCEQILEFWRSRGKVVRL